MDANCAPLITRELQSQINDAVFEIYTEGQKLGMCPSCTFQSLLLCAMASLKYNSHLHPSEVFRVLVHSLKSIYGAEVVQVRPADDDHEALH